MTIEAGGAAARLTVDTKPVITTPDAGANATPVGNLIDRIQAKQGQATETPVTAEAATPPTTETSGTLTPDQQQENTVIATTAAEGLQPGADARNALELVAGHAQVRREALKGDKKAEVKADVSLNKQLEAYRKNENPQIKALGFDFSLAEIKLEMAEVRAQVAKYQRNIIELKAIPDSADNIAATQTRVEQCIAEITRLNAISTQLESQKAAANLVNADGTPIANAVEKLATQLNPDASLDQVQENPLGVIDQKMQALSAEVKNEKDVKKKAEKVTSMLNSIDPQLAKKPEAVAMMKDVVDFYNKDLTMDEKKKAFMKIAGASSAIAALLFIWQSIKNSLEAETGGA
ncbi:MAG: hypothetical protein ACEQSA_02590 [Weeksellaceae bacterium]